MSSPPDVKISPESLPKCLFVNSFLNFCHLKLITPIYLLHKVCVPRRLCFRDSTLTRTVQTPRRFSGETDLFLFTSPLHSPLQSLHYSLCLTHFGCSGTIPGTETGIHSTLGSLPTSSPSSNLMYLVSQLRKRDSVKPSLERVFLGLTIFPSSFRKEFLLLTLP